MTKSAYSPSASLPMSRSMPQARAELGIADGDFVNIHSEWHDDADRSVEYFRVIAYPTAHGCAGTYFPEAKRLVPLESVAEGSNTPASKSVVVRLEPTA
ncbi:hypothetical protein [Pseudarthrobacter sp. N5]|uniref:hypothetical protein n=1 Tax=Pseudarthrobacter sp. N5 TaxID=3418416 RepID=UPI003CF25B5A